MYNTKRVYNNSISESGSLRRSWRISQGKHFQCARYKEQVTEADCQAMERDMCSECATGSMLRSKKETAR